MRALLFALLLMMSSNIQAFTEEQLRPFETDYCTNFAEGTFSRPGLWKHCCLKHDMLFWAGGDESDRDEADLGLRTCIEETGEKRIAMLMYFAVRVGSYSPIKYSDKKWNFGWPERPDYQPLSSEDIDQVQKELFSGYEFISTDVKNSFIHQLRSRLE